MNSFSFTLCYALQLIANVSLLGSSAVKSDSPLWEATAITASDIWPFLLLDTMATVQGVKFISLFQKCAWFTTFNHHSSGKKLLILYWPGLQEWLRAEAPDTDAPSRCEVSMIYRDKGWVTAALCGIVDFWQESTLPASKDFLLSFLFFQKYTVHHSTSKKYSSAGIQCISGTFKADFNTNACDNHLGYTTHRLIRSFLAFVTSGLLHQPFSCIPLQLHWEQRQRRREREITVLGYI